MIDTYMNGNITNLPDTINFIIEYFFLESAPQCSPSYIDQIGRRSEGDK